MSRFVCLLILISQFTYGQPNERGRITFSGNVVDATSGQGLEFATISLFSVKDSSLVAGTITDRTGKFELRFRSSDVYAIVEYLGYESQLIAVNKRKFDGLKTKAIIDLGRIELEIQNQSLGEVEVQAEKSTTQFSLDKKVFNVGKDIAGKGGTAEDILENVPSVDVDIDGNVTLRGNAGVRILIDGRPSTLVNAENTGSLRSISASQIKQVEVITNPSSRYEAEGMSGIINLILKKEKSSGFNGSFDISVGLPLRGGLGANVNYRKNKINWFANYSIAYREDKGGGDRYQEFYNEGILQRMSDLDRVTDRTGFTNTFRFGVDYFLKEKESITASLRYKFSDENNEAVLGFNDYFGPLFSLPGESTRRCDDEIEEESGLSYSLTYRKEYSSRKHFLQISTSYDDDLEKEHSDLNEINIQRGDSTIYNFLTQRSANQEGEKNWQAQLDFVRPLGKDHQYELGLKTTRRTVGNDYLVEQQDGLGAWEELDLSNMFEYNEGIYALYAQYANKWLQWSYQLGLRTEFSNIKTVLKTTDEKNKNDYFNLFPSAFLTYGFNEKVSLQFNYSYRISRPRFRYLNPFFSFSDNRNTFSGNPHLKPEYAHSLELNYLRVGDKLTLSSGLFYVYITDRIERITTSSGEGFTHTQPENISNSHTYGVDLNASFNVWKWLRLNANLVSTFVLFDGRNLDQNFDRNGGATVFRLNGKIKLPGGMDLQANFRYNFARQSVQARYGAVAVLNLGLSRDFLRSKNLTVFLNVRDVFNSRKRKFKTSSDSFFSEGAYRWRGRAFTLNANYRINQKKKRTRNLYDGGGGEF